MNRLTDTLGRVRVAAPCEADWDEMRGDERVRFCSRCSLNVYNLSAMTRREAEALVTSAEGGLCVRYYRRRDGTILTRNCPVGLRAVRRRIAGVARAAASAALSFAAGVAAFAGITLTAADETEGMDQLACPVFVPVTPGRVIEDWVEARRGETLELIQSEIVDEPTEVWANGQAELLDKQPAVTGRIVPIRRKASRK